MGFHFLTAFLVAYIVAGNLLAAALGTFFGNPISFPFIWASTYTTGNFILNRTTHPEAKHPGDTLNSLEMGNFWEGGITALFDQLVGIWHPIIKPMLVGSIPVGVSVSVVVYLITRWLAVKFKDRRQKQIRAKASALSVNKANIQEPV